MSLLDQLRAFGTKLGILHVEKPKDIHAPTKIMMRTISISELEVEVVATQTYHNQAELSHNFTAICEAHGITSPAHGWTIERLAQESQLIDADPNDHTAKQVAILERLSADEVPVEDIVRDAVARDQAIDAYATTMRNRFIQRAKDRLQRQHIIKQEMDRLSSEQQELDTDAAAEHDEWRNWWNRKYENEQNMALTVSYLLEKTIITIDTQVPSIEATASSHEEKPRH